jgi:TolB-like protein/Tfp pilus assembly protein PilF
MASLIPGYEYDIFISYRQKDNKHDGWVTEFVDNLKGELESTFKEEISVYFDINPHDGLLETYDVDASLKDKLKCLVFIPIISRTYCDPKSFAWEHEFKAFIEQAAKDQFGLKVKLFNGNIASRVIPVRIHELDTADIKECELVLGGILRSIEFIYKESGIDKPLAPEDDEKKNLNNTKYRIQIIKVAHAIKEIIQGMKAEPSSQDIRKTKVKETLVETTDEDKSKEISPTAIINQKSKKWFIISLSVVLCIVGAYAIFKIVQGSKRTDDISKVEKSIAVLPFVNDSPDQENTYFINGIMDEVLNNLQKIKDFRVLSRTSTELYRGTNRPSVSRIAKNLDVNYLVEGSGQKYGNKFVLRVQLIKTKDEKRLWGDSFIREIKETSDIIDLQSQIAQTIAEKLKTSITPEEKQLIEKTPTTNLTAYDFYQRGEEELRKYSSDNSNKQALKRAVEMYRKALEYDSAFALAYIGLSRVYNIKDYYRSYYSENFLDSVLILADIALAYDDHLADGYYRRAVYYISNGNIEQALKEYDKALKYNPNYWQAYWRIGEDVYTEDLKNADYVKALENLEKALSINHGLERPSVLISIGDAYCFYAGFPEKARYYYQEAFKLHGDSISYLADIGGLEIQYENFEEGVEKVLKAYAIDSNNYTLMGNLGIQYFYNRQYKESLKYFKKYTERLKSMDKLLTYRFLHIGYAYWQNGYKKEAEYWFNEQNRFSLKSIKLGREVVNDPWNGAYASLACLYAFKGEKEKAYEILRIIDHNSVFPYAMVLDLKKYNPYYDGIRNEPEFQKIVKDMESKYQAEHERVRKWLEEQGKL